MTALIALGRPSSVFAQAWGMLARNPRIFKSACPQIRVGSQSSCTIMIYLFSSAGVSPQQGSIYVWGILGLELGWRRHHPVSSTSTLSTEFINPKSQLWALTGARDLSHGSCHFVRPWGARHFGLRGPPLLIFNIPPVFPSFRQPVIKACIPIQLVMLSNLRGPALVWAITLSCASCYLLFGYDQVGCVISSP